MLRIYIRISNCFLLIFCPICNENLLLPVTLLTLEIEYRTFILNNKTKCCGAAPLLSTPAQILPINFGTNVRLLRVVDRVVRPSRAKWPAMSIVYFMNFLCRPWNPRSTKLQLMKRQRSPKILYVTMYLPDEAGCEVIFIGYVSPDVVVFPNFILSHIPV